MTKPKFVFTYIDNDLKFYFQKIFLKVLNLFQFKMDKDQYRKYKKIY